MSKMFTAGSILARRSLLAAGKLGGVVRSTTLVWLPNAADFFLYGNAPSANYILARVTDLRSQNIDAFFFRGTLVHPHLSRQLLRDRLNDCCLSHCNLASRFSSVTDS